MFSIVKVAREQTQPGSLLSRLGGKMRDPGNEVVYLIVELIFEPDSQFGFKALRFPTR